MRKIRRKPRESNIKEARESHFLEEGVLRRITMQKYQAR